MRTGPRVLYCMAVDVEHALVDTHLEAIVGVGTITARGATGGHGEHLGGDANGTAGFVLQGAGTVDDLGAHMLEVLDFARAKSEANTLDLLLYFFLGVFGLFGVHFSIS